MLTSDLRSSTEAIEAACRAVEALTADVPGVQRSVTVRREFHCYGECDAPNAANPCRGVRGPDWHGMGCRYISWQVSVPGAGGVEWGCFTPIYRSTASPSVPWAPLSTVFFHYAKPLPDADPHPYSDDCAMTGGACWVGSTSTAPGVDHGYDALVNGGNAAVWAWLGEAWLPHAVGPQS